MAPSWWFDQLAKVVMVCLTVSFLFSRNEQRQSQGKDTRDIITIQEAKKLTKQRKYENQQRNQKMTALLNGTGLSSLVRSPKYFPLIS